MSFSQKSSFAASQLRTALLRSTALVRLSLFITVVAVGVGCAPAFADGGAGGAGATGAGAGSGGADMITGNTGDDGVAGGADPGGGGGGGGGGAGGGLGGGRVPGGGGPGSGGASGGSGAATLMLSGDNGAAGGLVGDGGGGGGGGFQNWFQNATLVTSNTNFTGSAGGNGGAGNGSGGGGGGGAGGEQAGFRLPNATFNASSNVQLTGGAGGAGGSSAAGFGGSGGTGGVGVIFVDPGGTVNVGTGALLSGGAGGAGGMGGAGNGANGAGGVGIVGRGLTIINNGTISGGLNGDGVTRAEAIRLTGGAADVNTITFGNATAGIIGNIHIGASILTFAQSTDTTLAASITGFAGAIEKTGAGTLTLSGASTFGNFVNIRAGTLSITNDTNLGIGNKSISILDGARLAVTGNATFANNFGFFISGNPNFDIAGGTTSTIQGVITTTGLVGSGFTKTGAGTLELAGMNNYSGFTIVNAGTLRAGSARAFGIFNVLAVSGGATVDLNGFDQTFLQLSGAGTVTGANSTISRAFFAGDFNMPGTSMRIVGNLAFQSGALYVVFVNPATTSFANVTGTATLGGATAGVVFADGAYVQKKYTILTATGGINGTFSSFLTENAPSNATSTLSYDANNVYLGMILDFTIPGGLNGNQQNVANALTNFFNTTGGIPAVFANMSADGLSQAAGETATGSQQTTFNAMNQFMGAMMDPFIAGRGDAATAGGNASGFADEEALAYAAKKRNPNDALAAIYTKAPPMVPFQQRWSVWAAGFGGSQTTDGNTVAGSNTATSRIYGTAIGADYRFSPFTIAGFSLAGGGTNFSVANNGNGRSDLFQAGAFIRHNVGAAYLSGALAYGWQDVTTDRTVTIAGIDQLRARFNANAWSGRVEGGYRFVAPVIGGIGFTPYAAGQFTTFELPAYAEGVISGTNTFALAYGAKSVTDTRSELGLRTDKSFAMQAAILTLRGRVAWAHDFNPDRGIGVTFQTLPGASFFVNGAAQAADSALVTASAETKWMNGWSTAATFEGEFSNVTRSYAGKGVVRYAW
ncbi:autotransporter domain-containing protein [Bradyrhizobium sp. AUGA SZCCT0274]|uniref:autotransporter domain-containing protein n=3 Tax=Bradyrhizobium TaxID=374 RepID=UPI001BAB4428|nr:autotransporter domain-containing protein [Bradyrhizobium sp. AUGA SZCCT0274]MBR1244454.1 autotransporter domain-containing protein [Bradyrhizobium sp. AUGA SZCCT0274]